MKIVGTSFRRSHVCTAALSAAGLCQRLLDTHGQVWVGLWWGRCSFIFNPGAQGSVCASKSLFPQSCVSSGSSLVGLMATSSKRAQAIPRSAAPRALPLQQATADPPVPPQETLRHSGLAQCLWRLLVCTRFC